MPKKNRDAGLEAHDWSDFIVQRTPGAVITVDGQGRITDFNPAASELSGYRREETLG